MRSCIPPPRALRILPRPYLAATDDGPRRAHALALRAVAPAMNDVTGFFKFALDVLGRFFLALPPISPIMMTASVPGSLL